MKRRGPLPAPAPSATAESDRPQLSPEPRALGPALLPPAPYPLSPASPGLTLVELVLVIAIVGILAAAALPVTMFQIKRGKEKELHRDLWQIRAAIDQYKDAADKNAFQTKIDSGGYPPDLETLVNGVTAGTRKIRFLRSIPVDPMTGQPDWGTRAMQDDPDSDSGDGANVFDVFSKSTATALDGTKYNTW